jgi:hypothetical protein
MWEVLATDCQEVLALARASPQPNHSLIALRIRHNGDGATPSGTRQQQLLIKVDKRSGTFKTF